MKTSKLLSTHSELLPNIWRALHYSQGLKRIQLLETNILKNDVFSSLIQTIHSRTRWEVEVSYADWINNDF